MAGPARLPTFKCQRFRASHRDQIGIVGLAAASVFATGSAAGELRPVELVALDLIRMRACQIAWNYRVNAQSAPDANISDTMVSDSRPGEAAEMNGVKGSRYPFTSEAMANTAVCGYYFVPDASNSTARAAIADTDDAFITAAQDIVSLVDLSSEAGGQTGRSFTPDSIQFKPHVVKAIAVYEKAANGGPLPQTVGPPLEMSAIDGNAGIGGGGAWFVGSKNDGTRNLRMQVTLDLQKFDYALLQAMNAAPGGDASKK